MEDNKHVLTGPAPLEPIPKVSLGQLFYNKLTKNPNKQILIDSATGDFIFGKTLLTRSCIVAENLKLWGYGRNSIIAICSENRTEFFIPIIGALSIGAIVAPINNNYTKTEMLHTFSISKPKVLFCSRSVLPKIQKLMIDLTFIEKIIIIDGPKCDGIESLDCLKFQNFDISKFQFVEVDTQEQIAFIMCSSGTTGLPKGVMLTHQNVITSFILTNDPRFFNQDSNLCCLGYLPFYHSYGMFRSLGYILKNTQIIVMQKFDGESFLTNIEKYKITTLPLVPPVAIFLANSSLVDNYNLSSLVEVSCGAAPLSKSVEERLRNRLRIKSVNQAYGLTETTLRVVGIPFGDHKTGSSGKLLPFMSGKVQDPETGKSLKVNQIGEICFKGPLIMKGYYQNKEETQQALTHDGWFFTGDLGYYDENGYFYIVDRLKELIKYKGFQVPPAELEAVLLSNRKIKDAGVVGLPDPKAGELPLAFIVANPGTNITETEIKEFVAERLSQYKRLRGGVIFVSQIPKSASGKILRKELKKMLTLCNKSKL